MNYKLHVGREDNKDTFELAVELADGIDVDNMKFLAELKNDVDHELRSILGIGCKIRLLNPGALPRSEGKAVRVEDTRKL
jgi:phenylacetate-CoA ligase